MLFVLLFCRRIETCKPSSAMVNALWIQGKGLSDANLVVSDFLLSMSC